MVTGDLSTLLPRHLADRALSARGTLEGERKLVTVLFADVVGSTALASELDPEDLVELLNGLFSRWVTAVHRYEGTVDKFLGDGMLALFGAPLIHEDDPRRAVLAALEIRDATSTYAAEVGVPLEARIGLNTGTVVVGTVGSDARMEYTAIGDAVNVAQRVEAAARPGSVFVGSSTAALIEPYFEMHPEGAFDLKGKTEPEPLHEVVAGVEAGGSVHGVTGLSSPLVGRRNELDRLLEACSGLTSGQGATVAVVGEAGLGKSRLLAEVRAALDHVRWVQGHAVSFGATTPFLPLRTIVRDLRSADGDADRQALVEGELDHEDEGVRDRLIASIRRLVLADAPLVVAVEDLHWADAATQDTLAILAQATATHPVVLIVTTRPEALATAASFGAQVVGLEPLDDRARLDLVDELLGAAEVPEALGRLVVERAQGNPFFTEELLRALIEAGALTREAGGWRVSSEALPEDLPATVQGVVAARIDQLGEDAKRCVQAAAVLGLQFDAATLEAVLEEPPDLDRLVAAGFFERSGADHAFVHAITQDVAYASALKRQRRHLHGRAADIIEGSGPQAREARVAELGRHHDLAGRADRAVPYLALAARRSATAYDNAAALELSNRVLELTDDLAVRFDMLQLRSKVLGFIALHDQESAAVDQLRELAGDDVYLGLLADEAEIRAALGSGYLEAYSLCEAAVEKSEHAGDGVLRGRLLMLWATMQRRQYAPARAVAPLEEAVELFTEHREHHLRAAAISRLAGALWLVDPDRVHAVAAEALAAAEAARDPQLLAVAKYRIAISRLGAGAYDEATEGFEEVIELASGIGDRSMITEGHRLAAAGEAKRGDVEAADRHLRTALDMARSSGNAHGWLFACMSLVEQWEAQERFADMLELLGELQPQVETWDEPSNLSYIHYAYGYRALRWLNRPDEAAARLEAALAIVGDSPEWMPPAVMYRNGLAMLRVDQGRIDEAAVLLDEAVTLSRDNQLWEVTGSYLLVTEARVALAAGDHDRVEHAIRQLEELAGADDIYNTELHAVRMLGARLAMGRGEPQRAATLAQAALDQEPLLVDGRWHSRLHVYVMLATALEACGDDPVEVWSTARAAAAAHLASVPKEYRNDLARRPDVAAILSA